MAQPTQISTSQPSHIASGSRRQLPRSASSISLAFPQSVTVHNILSHGPHMRSSGTWTTSSGELGLLSDTDEIEDRAVFVQEYNRLAKKHGIRILVPEDFEPTRAPDAPCEKRGWLHRVFRSVTHTQNQHQPTVAPKLGEQDSTRHKRSVSDLAHIVHNRSEPPRLVNIQAMVRLSGKSVLYLPPEYTPCSLILPTCLRATAQHLAQNATSRGLFRIPGSLRIVDALFEYYCYAEGVGMNISRTVRCATLPVHIQYSVHDVASTFKRLLSVLPGGILGSLALFDAFVAIHSQLHGEPEFPRTKQTKIRGRLLALAIGTIKSQFRRELICAVFGLLSLIGRIAEVTPREDEDGRPLPTTDLMGYTALGIVFGPLLVGDLLDQYVMKLASPNSGMLLFPLSPPKRRRERRKAKAAQTEPPVIDKILIANNIAEMVIANWRDVVRQMRALGTYYRRETSSSRGRLRNSRGSASGCFAVNMPQRVSANRSESIHSTIGQNANPQPGIDMSLLERGKARSAKDNILQNLGPMPSAIVIDNTRESGVMNGDSADDFLKHQRQPTPSLVGSKGKLESQDRLQVTLPAKRSHTYLLGEGPGITQVSDGIEQRRNLNKRKTSHIYDPLRKPLVEMPQVYVENVPARVSSRHGRHESSGTFISSFDEAYLKQLPRLIQSSSETLDRTNQFESDERSRSEAATKPPEFQIQSPRNMFQINPNLKQPSSRPQKSLEEETMAKRSPSTKTQHSTLDTLPERSSTPLTRIENRQLPTLDSQTEGTEASPKGCLEMETATISRDRTKQSSTQAVELVRRNSVGGTPRRFYSSSKPPTLGSSIQISPLTNRVLRGESQEYTPERSSEKSQRPRTRRHADLANTPELPCNALPQNTSRRATPHGQTPSQRMENERPRYLLSAKYSALRGPRGSKSMGQLCDPPEADSHWFSSSSSPTKRASVKAMAAMFDSQEKSPKSSPLRKQLDAATSSSSPRKESNVQDRDLRPRRLGLIEAPNPPPKPPWLSSEQHSRSNWSPGRSCLRRSPSPSDGIILNGKILTYDSCEKKTSQEPSLINQPLKAVASLEPAGSKTVDRDGQLRPIPMLGSMTPHAEQPSIAQHLKRKKPQRSPPNVYLESENPPAPSANSSSPPRRPAGTTALYSLIRQLQRQLDVKTEEAAQLMREVEAHNDAEIGTLSEQLREANRDASMWKDRAESAERRVKVFEKYTAKLREIRDGRTFAGQSQSSSERDGDHGTDHLPGKSAKNKEKISRSQHVRFAEGIRLSGRATDGGASEDSGITEDTAVVAARIRACLHGSPWNHDGAHDSPSTQDESPPERTTLRGKTVGDIYAAAMMEMWAATEEILQMEDAGLL